MASIKFVFLKYKKVCSPLCCFKCVCVRACVFECARMHMCVCFGVHASVCACVLACPHAYVYSCLEHPPIRNRTSIRMFIPSFINQCKF